MCVAKNRKKVKMNITTNYQLKSFNTRVNHQQLQINPSFGINKQIIENGLEKIIPVTFATVTAETVLAMHNKKTKVNDGLSKATKALDEMGIKYVIDEKDGLLTVDSLPAKLINEYQKNNQNFNCNDVTHYVKKILSGNVDCTEYRTKDPLDFSNLEYVGGNVKYAPTWYRITTERGYAEYAVGVNMANLKCVEGNFVATFAEDEQSSYEEGNVYPKNLEKIGGYADIYAYVDLPKLTQIGRSANFSDCDRVYLPNLESVGGHLNIRHVHDICLDNLKSLKGLAFIGHSEEAYNALGECKNKASNGLPYAVTVDA